MLVVNECTEALTWILESMIAVWLSGKWTRETYTNCEIPPTYYSHAHACMHSALYKHTYYSHTYTCNYSPVQKYLPIIVTHSHVQKYIFTYCSHMDVFHIAQSYLCCAPIWTSFKREVI